MARLSHRLEGRASDGAPAVDGSWRRNFARNQTILGGYSVSLKLHQRPALEAGDPDQFSMRMEFVPNLDSGFATPEEDLSWGRLQIWVAGRNLCEHVDRSEVQIGRASCREREEDG